MTRFFPSYHNFRASCKWRDAQRAMRNFSPFQIYRLYTRGLLRRPRQFGHVRQNIALALYCRRFWVQGNAVMGWGGRHSMELLAHLFQEGLLSLYCFAYLRNVKKLSPVISNRSFRHCFAVHSIIDEHLVLLTHLDRYICKLLIDDRVPKEPKY